MTTRQFEIGTEAARDGEIKLDETPPQDMHQTNRWAGLGVRPGHFAHWMRESQLGWAEFMSDNLMGQDGGPMRFHHEQIARNQSVLLHGVGLNIAGDKPLDLDYLSQLQKLISEFDPVVVSDHLCATGAGETLTYDLLPPVYCEAMLDHVAHRIERVRNFLKRNIALENISSYVRFRAATMNEGEFLARLCTMTGCELLLDLNNLEVNEINHGWSARNVIESLPIESVVQYHLSGHSRRNTLAVDTHGQNISAFTWSLFASAVDRLGPHPTILERDDDGADFQVCKSELLQGMASIMNQIAEPLERQRVPASDSSKMHNEKRGNKDQGAGIQNLESSFGLSKSLVAAIWQGRSLRSATTSDDSYLLPKILAPATSENLFVHREALSIRLGEVLAKTILEPCSKAFGVRETIGLLQQYFYENPPSAPLLQNTIDGLPTYLDKLPLAEKGTLLRDLCTASIAAWHIRKSADPFEDPQAQPGDLHTFVLVREAKFCPSAFALHELWTTIHAEGNAATFNISDFLWQHRASGILFFKQSRERVHAHAVPKELQGVVEQLVSGLTLDQALEEGIRDDSPLETETFCKWVTDLARSGCLRPRMTPPQFRAFPERHAAPHSWPSPALRHRPCCREAAFHPDSRASHS